MKDAARLHLRELLSRKGALSTWPNSSRQSATGISAASAATDRILTSAPPSAADGPHAHVNATDQRIRNVRQRQKPLRRKYVTDHASSASAAAHRNRSRHPETLELHVRRPGPRCAFKPGQPILQADQNSRRRWPAIILPQRTPSVSEQSREPRFDCATLTASFSSKKSRIPWLLAGPKIRKSTLFPRERQREFVRINRLTM